MTDTRNLNGNDGNNKTETAANIAELKGRLSAAREAGKTTAIIKIPVPQ